MTISEALKELIVAIKGSGNEKDIKEETIADIISYMAENWDSISGGVSQTGITVDTLNGATDVGKSVMKAVSQEAARTAIGAGVQYTLPAAGIAIGGVKKAGAVAAVSAQNAGTIGGQFAQAEVQKIATLADANKTAINEIISKLKAAGIMG